MFRALAPLGLLKVKDVGVLISDSLLTDHLIRDENIQYGSQAPHVSQLRYLGALRLYFWRKEDAICATNFVIEPCRTIAIYELHQGQVFHIDAYLVAFHASMETPSDSDMLRA